MAAPDTATLADERGQPSGTGTTSDELRGLPTPYRDQALYREVVEAGFAAYPERRANHERYKKAKRGETLDHLPVQLDVENLSRCNFRCTMCQVSTWEKGQRAEDMTLGDFKNLIDEQIGLLEIKLQGMGEPLMAGDVFFDMIKMLASDTFGSARRSTGRCCI